MGTFLCVILRDLVLQLIKLLKKLEFIIIPVANPDGYHVSQTLLNKCTEKEYHVPKTTYLWLSIPTIRLLGLTIPSIGSGGRTWRPPQTQTVMEWTLTGILTPTGAWYTYVYTWCIFNGRLSWNVRVPCRAQP